MSTPPPGSYGDSLVGRTLGGAYRLVDLIGAGGFADVYLARDLRTNVTVAVKILHAHVAREAGLVQRFRTEADVARRLRGPNVARALDSGQEANLPPHLVMEYVQGLPLSEIIRRRGQFPVQDAVQLIDQALAALGEAHRLGIVHRDIKPANLMVDANGVLKVMDFGIARLLEGGSAVTSTGHILGTPAYMAPEQVSGQPIDVRTDLYAAGIVLYELLAGKSPFGGVSDPMVAMSRVVNETPPPITTVRPDVPPALAHVIARALAKSPEWRFQSAAEMRQALAQALGPSPTAVMAPAPTTPPFPPTQPGSWPPPPSTPAGQGGVGGIPPQPPFAVPPGGPQPYGGRLGFGALPMPPGRSSPYGAPQPKPGGRSPVPIILGIGAVLLLLMGGVLGMYSTGVIGGRATPTPTQVRLAAATPTRSTQAATATPAPTPPAKPTAAAKPTLATLPTVAPAKPTTPPQPTPAPPTAVPVRPTATLLPRSIFQANFNNGDPRGLFIGFSTNREREHLVWDGEYVIKTLINQPANSIAFLPNTQGVTDGVLAANVRIIDGADYAFVSVNCRAQNTDLVSHYSAQLSTTPPAVRLRRVDQGQSNPMVDWTQNAAIRGGRAVNRLEIRCLGSEIGVAVNGVQIINVQDNRYQAGWWSLGAGTFGDMTGRAEGRFDDVDLRAP